MHIFESFRRLFFLALFYISQEKFWHAFCIYQVLPILFFVIPRGAADDDKSIQTIEASHPSILH